MSTLPSLPDASNTSNSAAAASRQESSPTYPTLRNSRFDVLADFWFIFADSTRNSFHLNEIAWDHVGGFTVLAFLAAAAIDWYLPGSQLGFDVGLTLLTGIAAIVAYAVRAGIAERTLNAARATASPQDSSGSTPKAA